MTSLQINKAYRFLGIENEVYRLVGVDLETGLHHFKPISDLCTMALHEDGTMTLPKAALMMEQIEEPTKEEETENESKNESKSTGE